MVQTAATAVSSERSYP